MRLQDECTRSCTIICRKDSMSQHQMTCTWWPRLFQIDNGYIYRYSSITTRFCVRHVISTDTTTIICVGKGKLTDYTRAVGHNSMCLKHYSYLIYYEAYVRQTIWSHCPLTLTKCSRLFPLSALHLLPQSICECTTYHPSSSLPYSYYDHLRYSCLCSHSPSLFTRHSLLLSCRVWMYRPPDYRCRERMTTSAWFIWESLDYISSTLLALSLPQPILSSS